jgi:CheY-like chemotaxis protein
MNNKLPLYFFPTQIVFVDDDPRAFEEIRLLLNNDLATYSYYHNPHQAINVINSNSKAEIFFNKSTTEEIDYNTIYQLYNEVYNPNRFNEISCIVIDYDMPGMDGLELCRKIKNPYIKKILLTGAADENLAIDAFNQGLINTYIRKHEPGVYDLLNNHIYSGQQSYFRALTTPPLDIIFKKWATAIFDPKFTIFFKNFIKEKKIVEYYLIDLMGSFLCIAADGTLNVLFMFNDEALDQNLEAIEERLYYTSTPAKSLPNGLLEDLKMKNKALCFPFTGDNMHPHPSEWAEFVYSLQMINGQQPYYIAYVSDIDYLPQEKLSFNQYKQKLR